MRHGLAEDVHIQVHEIVESSLAKLKVWLDIRLQKQEDLLKCLSDVCQVPRNPGLPVSDSVDILASKVAPVCESKAATFVNDDFHKEHLEKDHRLTATSADEPQSPISATLLEECPLPGSVGEMQTDTKSLPLPDFAAKRGKSVRTLHGEWQAELMDIFDQLDLDFSGNIDRAEFLEASRELGMTSERGLAVFKSIDKGHSTVIDRVQWLHIIEEAARGRKEDINELVDFLESLAKRQMSKGKVYETDRTRRPCCIIRHDSAWRASWDMLMMVMLFYVAVMVPYQLGFGETKVLKVLDGVVDIIFCCDILLNFRTSYVDRDESIITDGKQIAKRYLKSWFLPDLVSSFPFDLVTAGVLPDLTPARLLKIGKTAKVMKLVRVRLFTRIDTVEMVADMSSSRVNQTIYQIAKLVFMTIIFANWLASFGAAIDTSSLDAYFAGESEEVTAFQKYIAAMYWAMTTLSTVGYGDITPKTDAERGYAMLAMIIGGALYGYVIGSITSTVTEMDVNERACNERMELIQSWLDRHQEMPKILRRKVLKYFKRKIVSKFAMDDIEVFAELSADLRADAAHFLIHTHVKFNPMFKKVPNGGLANLIGILETHHFPPKETVVKAGDKGVAMYILVDGVARYDVGVPWQPRDGKAQGKIFQLVKAGNSFGEEILFDLKSTYLYSVKSMTNCEFHAINNDGFKERFHNDELYDLMLAGFLKSKVVDTDS